MERGKGCVRRLEANGVRGIAGMEIAVWEGMQLVGKLPGASFRDSKAPPELGAKA